MKTVQKHLTEMIPFKSECGGGGGITGVITHIIPILKLINNFVHWKIYSADNSQIIIKTGIILTWVYCKFQINSKIRFIYFCVNIGGREIFLSLKVTLVAPRFVPSKKKYYSSEHSTTSYLDFKLAVI